MIYQFFSFLLLLLTPLFTHVLVVFFKLKRFGILFTDLSFLMFSFEIYLVGNYFLSDDIFYYYLMCLSLLAIGITITFLKRSHFFSYKRFLKFFFRFGFLTSFLFYSIIIIIVIFTKHWLIMIISQCFYFLSNDTKPPIT